MWSHTKMLEAAYKIIQVIKSCKTRHHFKSTKALINNFHSQFKFQKNSNKLIVGSYTEHLLNIYQRQYNVILH